MIEPDNGRAALAEVLGIDPAELVACSCGRWIARTRQNMAPLAVGYVERQRWYDSPLRVQDRLVPGRMTEIECDCGAKLRWYLYDGVDQYTRIPPPIRPEHQRIDDWRPVKSQRRYRWRELESDEWDTRTGIRPRSVAQVNA